MQEGGVVEKCRCVATVRGEGGRERDVSSAGPPPPMPAPLRAPRALSADRALSLSLSRALCLCLSFFLLYLSFTKRAHNLPLSEKTFTDSAPRLKGSFPEKIYILLL